MVNITAIACIYDQYKVELFTSVAEYRHWRLSRCRSMADQTALRHHYNFVSRQGERYLEGKYNLAPGSMAGIHHLFNTTARADHHIREKSLFNILAEDHAVILETNRSLNVIMVTLYSKRSHTSFAVNLREEIELGFSTAIDFSSSE